jgi:hypothetical protein
LAKLATLVAPSGKTGRIRSTDKKFRGFFFPVRTFPTSGVEIAATIVLAQYKGHERIGEVWKNIDRASPVVTEIT